ncbi:MAG: tyrosine-type recombinase/integrase [Acidobacteria bacterium]|nr:tyrosine-type recombinase/integrase [Acidobacteriota bacterium]
MTTEALTPEIFRGGESPARSFDPKSASPFVNKSVSEQTRRAYGRALREFFQFIGMKHPSEVVPDDVLLWRDRLRSHKKSAATVAFKLSVVRSFFEYLKAAGAISLNPASTRLVSPPELRSEPAGRALSSKEVRYLLSGPDRGKPEGARDYALMLVMLRLSLRVSEVCSLRASSVRWSHGRWTLRCKVKGGREEVWPLPKDVKEAVDHYLRLDRSRREVVHSGGEDAHLFQPVTNYRTLEFSKALSTRMAQKIVKRWADYSRLGDLSPHDLRRTAITRALDSGLTYRQVQMMSKHKDPKTVMRYDHGRENMEQNAVNFLRYDEETS